MNFKNLSLLYIHGLCLKNKTKQKTPIFLLKSHLLMIQLLEKRTGRGHVLQIYILK